MSAPAPAADPLDLEGWDLSTPPTFQDLLARLYTAKFQGSVTLHFAGGIPRAVVLNQPKSIPLDTPGRKGSLTSG